jgi:3-phosphoshikimate 1-carboxyvinyltransferase
MSELSFVARMADLELPSHAVVIADRALPDALLTMLPEPLLVEAGEQIKTLAEVGALAERVLARRSTRPLVLVVVGGGSLGDAAGFLASILWRGVPVWHVPTTLVAMVDSAHGGKTAVNLGESKNQLGTFHPAERVIIVDEALETLPLPQRREGLAELIKALWLGDAPALDLVEEIGVGVLASAPMSVVGERLRVLIRRAIEVKHAVVARDPQETLGIRTWLNFGHTAAHALELELGLAHGLAVAWGMAAASELLRAWPGVDASHAERLWSHMRPLLTPLELPAGGLDAARFVAALSRDKKRVAGALRSVLLRAAGDPFVTEQVSPAMWFEALMGAQARLLAEPLRVELSTPYPAALRMEASKSELNRALIIAALRPGATEVVGESHARDVLDMRGALKAWRSTPSDAALVAHAGLGGTTLRFLLAAALTRQAPTTLLASPHLLARPHAALFAAIEALGGRVEAVEGGLRVVPGAPWSGASVAVRCDVSSQYASALALLATCGQPLTLVLRTSDEGYDEAAAASIGYLRMTLAMVEQAGVAVDWRGDTITLTPTPALREPVTLVATPDESSAAMWRCLAALGHPARVVALPEASLQADRALGEVLERLIAAGEGEVSVSLRESPDLAPVLAATAALLPCGLTITDAAHLRYKESDRIAQLIAALAAAGVLATPREDGLYVAPGVQQPRAGAVIPTAGDHRLAMAALVLSWGAPLVIADAWVVAKSYPSCWHDAAAAGWAVLTDRDRDL